MQKFGGGKIRVGAEAIRVNTLGFGDQFVNEVRHLGRAPLNGRRQAGFHSRRWQANTAG